MYRPVEDSSSPGTSSPLSLTVDDANVTPSTSPAAKSPTSPSATSNDYISTTADWGQPDTGDMKRTNAKKLIERYFYQLSDGCGNPDCVNRYCASSGAVRNLTPNQAAARAIQLFSEDAQLCDVFGTRKMARSKSPPVGGFVRSDNSSADAQAITSTTTATLTGAATRLNTMDRWSLIGIPHTLCIVFEIVF